MSPHWYLGFDPATKTFGFSIVKIDKENIISQGPNIILELLETKNIKKSQKSIRSLFDIIDGDTIDLCPGKSNTSINLVDRIEACATLVKTRIIPQIADIKKENLTVVIESQMNPNDKSGIVPNVLISLLYDRANIVMLGASVKNTAHLYSRHHPKEYSKKLSWKTAIKHHTRFTLVDLVKDFNIKSLKNKTNAEMGHIGDSFMQILGHIQNPEMTIKG